MEFDNYSQNTDSDTDGFITPLIEILFVILTVLLLGFIAYREELENQTPAPVIIETDGYFDSGSAIIKGENYNHFISLLRDSLKSRSKIIDSLALRSKLSTIQIEGHTDAVPLSPYSRYQDNEELSYHRAYFTFRQIKNVINSESVLFADSLFAVAGYGSRRMKVKTNRAEEKNRRIEIVFYFRDMIYE